MSVGREKNRPVTAGIFDKCQLKRFEVRENELDRLACEQSKVCRDLVVATSAGMEFERNRADFFSQCGLDKSVDIFIRHRLHFVRRILTEDAFQPAIDRLPFLFVENAGAEQTPGVSTARADIDFEKNRVDGQRSIHLLEDRVLLLFKPSLPEFHISRDRALLERTPGV